jgi:hypothetical protein
MMRSGIRVGIVAATVAAMSSGAFLAFPAHADGVSCTSPTGASVCVKTVNSGGILGAVVSEGTAPDYPDTTAVAVACGPGVAAVEAWANGGRPLGANIPIPVFGIPYC